MRSKIIESEIGGLWLKVIVAVLDDDEINYPSALPYNQQNAPGMPLHRLEHKINPRGIWILDLSTNEGAAFIPGERPELDVECVGANL